MLQAQVTENFNDGDFIVNPAWTGDSNQFAINSGQLQLSSSGTDSSYLVTAYGYSGGNYEWDFWLKQAFAPSSSNYGRIYLASNQSNFKGSLNGYFLQYGESGSNDAVELFRQDGIITTSLGRGVNGQINSSFNTRVKVIRDSLGNWKVQTNYSGSTNFTSEILANDNKYLPGLWFGIRCNYTSSNATKFYLDDIYIGKEVFDTIPPKILSISIIDSLHINVRFSEATDSIKSINLNHFEVIPLIGKPNNISKDSLDPTLLMLTLGINLTNGASYLLYIDSIFDLSENILLIDSIRFAYITTAEVERGDITITEIMANPTGSPALPNAEYIEIYNRSNNYLSTKDWKISDASTTVIMPDDTIEPNSYNAYCTTVNLNQFQQFGIANIKGLSSLPSLNNDGDFISIKDQNENILDQLNYNLNYYHNTLKSAGGWSIERIDKNFLCTNENNWNASKDLRGGTPGLKNSNEHTFSDNTSPYLVHITIIDSINIRLHFSEAVDTLLAKNNLYFIIDKNIGTPQFSYTENYDASIIHLKLQNKLTKNILYSVIVSNSLKDCAGNKITKYLTGSFGIADSVSKSDLVINEVLFNPKTDGSDYVEVYNTSKKTIDLRTFKIANADPTTGIIGSIYSISTESWLINPGQYIVLTEDNLAVINSYHINDSRMIIKISLPSYNDDEGIIVLLNSSLDKIDEFHYTDKMHFPLLTDVEGISLERISPYQKSEDFNNWHSASSSCGYGTPGYKNSQYFIGVETTSLLEVIPELFSPDNDGEKDNITFSINTDKPGYYASLRIFNSEGVEVKTITENELLGNKTSWSWDGINNENALEEIGIYIVYLEMVHPNGEVINDKKTFVLAHKI